MSSKKYNYKWGHCYCGRRTTRNSKGVYECLKCHKKKMKHLNDKLNDSQGMEAPIDKMLEHSPYKEQLQEFIDSEEYKLLQSLKKQGLSKVEMDNIVRNLKGGKPAQDLVYNLGKNNFKFLAFGDSHIGHEKYDSGLTKHALKQAEKEKVDFVLHTGDVVDGWYQNRPQSLFEQTEVGFDRQLDRAVKEFVPFKKLGVPFYFITGNHEYNTYMRGAGVEFGNVVQDRLKQEGLDAHYLGNAEATLKTKGGSDIKLLHPDGGTAYALSYKPQKIIESLDGGAKPNILLVGHFHKAEYLFYRNVHCLQTGTLCGQTKFMKGKGIPAHKGFWIVDVNTNDKGEVGKFSPTLYPAYK